MFLRLLLILLFITFSYCQVPNPDFNGIMKPCDEEFKCKLITNNIERKKCYSNCLKNKKNKDTCLRKKDKNGIYELKYNTGTNLRLF